MSLSTLSPEQRELFELLSERTRPEAAPPEPIAVVGIGCRFPGGANDPNSFWRLLVEGRDAVREAPCDRWNLDAYYDPDPDAPGKMWTRHGGFLDHVDRFDAAFFGISPREAIWMDPQQRLLLEVAWEALENGGIAPDSLAGSRTGVFVGICTSDYFRWAFADVRRIGAYCATGTFPSAAAGRISYVLGLQGPCIAVDTACSSSLVSVHLACQSLRQKECEVALAGGVSLLLSPDASVNFTKAHMLAPDGRCKTFDSTADGYGRGEGCGMVVLKPLSAARRDGDAVWGTILGSAVNQDGRSNGLTAPNPLAQEDLLRAALANARVQPADVSYLEAHGTGTPLGDPIEIGAIAAVLGRDRPNTRPLHIGTVKTNIGHLEIAAGVAGLIKTLLCLRHRALAPNLHFREINPNVAAAIGELPIKVCQRGQAWTGTDGRLIAGVSSFGFGGTNAHVLVEGAGAAHLPLSLAEGRSEGGLNHADVAPPNDHRSPHAPPEENHYNTLRVPTDDGYGAIHVLCLSAKTRAALTELARSYADFLARTDADIADVCFTANVGRAHFDHRLAVGGATCGELADKLEVCSTAARGCVSGTAVASARSSASDKTSLATNGDTPIPRTLAERYLRGDTIDWRDIYANHRHRRVALPTYPFQRERYWLDVAQAFQPDIPRSAPSPSKAPVPYDLAPAGLESLTYVHPLLGRRLRTASRDIIYESHLRPTSPASLADHVVRGSVVVPGAAFAEVALAAAHHALKPCPQSPRPYRPAHRLLSTSLPQFLPLDAEGRLLQTVLTPHSDGSFTFTCSSADAAAGADAVWTLHANGTISAVEPLGTGPTLSLDDARALCQRQCDAAEYYHSLSTAGLDYGPCFRGIAELWFGERCALARVAAPPELAASSAKYCVHPALLDACLQSFLAAFDGDAELYVPAGWEVFEPASDHRRTHAPREGNHHAERDDYGTLEFDRCTNLWACARLDNYLQPNLCGNEAPSCERIGNLTIFDSDGNALIEWSGIRLQRLPRPMPYDHVSDTETDAPQTSSATEQDSDDLLAVIHDCAVRVLELPPGETIAPHDNLYDLGMDSIMATELLFHIEKALNCSLPMQAMSKSKTILQIAEMVCSTVKQPVKT